MKTRRHFLIWLIAASIAFSGTTLAADVEAKEEAKLPWAPPVPEHLPEKWDWIQLTSLEWLKGEFIALYDESLEFESDELDTLTLDWSDVKRVRTARRMEVLLRGRVEARGRLFVEDDLVRIVPRDGEEQEYDRDDLVSATIGSSKEIDHWKMKVSLGGNTRTGNTDVTEINLTARFVRRSAINRLLLDYIGNYNVTEGFLVTNNHRATIGWDRFVSDRFFWSPISFEYYRDPFLNINYRGTFSIGIGYHIIDGKKAEWDITGGPGSQRTLFDDVVVGEPDTAKTPTLTIASDSDIELTGWLDFITEYRFQFTNRQSGSYNHHMVVAFENDITDLLDFDIRWVWDRIQNPQPDSTGIVPEQDDFRLIVALGFDF